MLTMNVYKFHGMLQALAFLILYPLGALIAIFRQRIGPSWFYAHIGIQLVATICVFTAVGFVIFTKHKHEQQKKIPQIHRILGKTLVGIILLQYVWAIFGKRFVSWSVWLVIHMILAGLLLTLGWLQIYLGYRIINGTG